MAEEKRATLQDMISYMPDSYLSDDELALIRSTFHGERGSDLLKVVRKIFIPSVHDPELPIEELGKDVWMSQVDFRSMAVEEIKAIVQGRQEAIKFIIGGLIQLKNIANIKAENEADRSSRLKKDSTK